MKKSFLSKLHRISDKRGGVGGYGLLWLIGVPLPILAIIFIFKGCN